MYKVIKKVSGNKKSFTSKLCLLALLRLNFGINASNFCVYVSVCKITAKLERN